MVGNWFLLVAVFSFLLIWGVWDGGPSGPTGLGMVIEDEKKEVFQGFDPTPFFLYSVYSLVPACRVASEVLLSRGGYARLMLLVDSCSCIFLSVSPPWDFIGYQLIELPFPFLLCVWVTLGPSVGSCPWVLSFLIPSGFCDSCSSSGIPMAPLMPRCHRGDALFVPRYLVPSRPWAESRAFIFIFVYFSAHFIFYDFAQSTHR